MSELKTLKLTKLIIGDRPFHSNGVSTVKITQIDENGRNDEIFIDIPIQSIGIPELMENLNKNRPKPPSKQLQVKKNTELAKELGLQMNCVVQILDYSDENYQKEIQKYNEEEGWDILLKGICIDFEDEAGNKIADNGCKKEILKNSGLTNNHMLQIVNDINSLTSNMEASADFLSGKL